MENRADRALRFGRMFSSSREFARKTQSYMAECHGVSTKTIQSWESGATSPTFSETNRWFEYCGMNPTPYYLEYVYPNEFRIYSGNVSDEDVKAALSPVLRHSTPPERRLLHFLIHHTTGGDFSALMQLFAANIQTQLSCRVITSNLIRACYIRAEKEGTLLFPNKTRPDIRVLNEAISLGQHAASVGAHGYSNTSMNLGASALDTAAVSGSAPGTGNIYAASRQQTGVSQDYMAMSLGISKRTLSNWEHDKSEPSFFVGTEWFRILNLDPFPWYKSLLWPIEESENQKEIDEGIKDWYLNSKAITRRCLLFLLAGRHGSSPYSYLNMMAAFVQLPLRDSVLIADTILRSYTMSEASGQTVCLDNIRPDVEELTRIVAELSK